jgi:hypothetical protein
MAVLLDDGFGPGLFFCSVYIGAGGKKQESHWAWQPQRLVSRQCWVDWPAQPYLKPAQTI